MSALAASHYSMSQHICSIDGIKHMCFWSVQGRCGASRYGFRRDVPPWQMACAISLRSALWILPKLGALSFAHNPCITLASPAHHSAFVVARFASIYHYDFKLFQQRFLGEEGVAQWKSCNTSMSLFSVDLCHSKVHMFVTRPLIDSGKLCDLLNFSRTTHCYQQQLLVCRNVSVFLSVGASD